MARAEHLRAVALCIALAACSSTIERAEPPPDRGPSEPTTIELRSRSDLRRLILVPPQVTLEDCAESRTGPGYTAIEPEAVARRLRDWKGYEVTVAEQSADTDRLVLDAARWHEQLERAEPVPAELVQRLNELTSGRSDTGLLLIHSHPRCPTAMDVTLHMLVVGMPRYYRKTFERNTSIAFYDSSKAELVWMRFFNVLAPDAANERLVPLEAEVLGALDGLPDAVPP